MIVLREYLGGVGRNQFRDWFNGLDVAAATKVAVALERMAQGNKSSNEEGVGEGVLEYKIDFGPGYRIYFGKDGEHLVILLGGGTKRGQAVDIEAAQAAWREYKQRKKAAQKRTAENEVAEDKAQSKRKPKRK